MISEALENNMRIYMYVYIYPSAKCIDDERRGIEEWPLNTGYLDTINDERRKKKGKEREGQGRAGQGREGKEKHSVIAFERCRKFLNSMMMKVLTGRRKLVLQKNIYSVI